MAYLNMNHYWSRIKKTMGADVSMTSLSSMMSQKDELKIGDRVIVSSMQGSKTGVLKYQGPTHFAGGEWYGVELDEPLGKNDGSVNGKRCAFPLSNLVKKNPPSASSHPSSQKTSSRSEQPVSCSPRNHLRLLVAWKIIQRSFLSLFL